MEIGEGDEKQEIKLQRASIGMTQASGLEMGVNAMSMLAGTTSQDLAEGRVLQLLNMVTPEELIDNDEYEGLLPRPHAECKWHSSPIFDDRNM
jgi:splicing factor U2AF subunit